MKTIHIIPLVFLALFFSLFWADKSSALDKPVKKNERYYVDKYCLGRKNVKMADGTWCDCVTKTHAIEFDFAKKWAESIGQAAHYARLEGLKPGVVLICSTTREAKHIQKVRDNSDFYGLQITVWSVNCGL